jgi:hypothetical protein
MRVLVTIAAALLVVSVIAAGMGRQAKTGVYVLVGYRFFLGSLAVFLVAGLFWSLNWIKEHVRIK